MIAHTAANLPQVWWSAIPFDYNSNDPGTQMQREVVADMAADPTQNVTVVLPQTADSLPRSIGGPPLVYNPTTGVWSGGDPLHRDIPDNQRFGMLAAPLVARAVLASTGGRYDFRHPGRRSRDGRAGGDPRLSAVEYNPGGHGPARLRHRPDRARHAGGRWDRVGR